MRPNRKIARAGLTALLALSIATIASCGDDDEQTAAGNPTDRAFARAMIPHHQSAVAMARLAKNRARHPELRSLADAIATTQTAEIRTLRRLDGGLRDEGDEHGHLGLDQHMMGMSADMPMLRSTRDFDRAFIDMMVPHHQGAVRMAKVELGRGENRGLRRLARSIIAAQDREIDQMREWREAWYGSSDGGGYGDDMMGH
jgi:uncharacterized protein (DUF305 family)